MAETIGEEKSSWVGQVSVADLARGKSGLHFKSKVLVNDQELNWRRFSYG